MQERDDPRSMFHVSSSEMRSFRDNRATVFEREHSGVPFTERVDTPNVLMCCLRQTQGGRSAYNVGHSGCTCFLRL